MKKLNMAFGVFSLYFSLFPICALSEMIKLEREISSKEYDRLAPMVKKSSATDWVWFLAPQSFKVTLTDSFKYYMASSTSIVEPKATGGESPIGRGYCAFDFFNENYNRVNGIRVHIQDSVNRNVCNHIEGVSAVSYQNQPALLATVQYHRGIDPAKTVDEIGNNYHDFTALLVLTPHPDGSLSIHQDDSCLGPMNQIGELATARKRIAECSQ